MNAPLRTRLLLIEDQPIYLAGLQRMCADKFDRVQSHMNLQEAGKDVMRGGVSLAIYGLNHQPNLELKYFLEQAREHQVPTIILTTTHHWQDIQTCIAWGAKGIFAKEIIDLNSDLCMAAMQDSDVVLQTFFPPDFFHVRNARFVAAPHPKRLSRQELRVLSLRAQGQTYRQMGDAMGVSVKTISVYLQRIVRKMAIKNPAEFYLLAERLGIEMPPAPLLAEQI